MIEKTDIAGVWRLADGQARSSDGIDGVAETALLRRPPASILPVSWLEGERGQLFFRPDNQGLPSLREVACQLDNEPAKGYCLLKSVMRSVDEAADHLFELESMVLNPDLIFVANWEDTEPEVKIVCLPLAGGEGENPLAAGLLDWLADNFRWEADFSSSLQVFYRDPANWGHLPGTDQDKTEEDAGPPFEKQKKETAPSHYRRFSPLSRLRDLFAGYGSPESIHEETEELDLAHRPMRIAQLSEGLPGTPEEDLGRRAYILTEEFIIGRDIRDADLRIDSAAISRQHARITLKGGNFFLEDLGSRNGTRLDGVRLNRKKEYRLPDKCRLAFAEEHFYFRSE